MKNPYEYHPNPEKIENMCRLFELEAQRRCEIVDMSQGTWYLTDEERIKDHCDTPGCHAGLYAIVNYREVERYQFDLTNQCEYDLNNYKTGVNLMNRDLCPSHYEDLREWASMNSAIWGNPYGGLMFRSALAFGELESQSECLMIETIVEHWRGVAKRIRDLRQ